MTDKKGVHLIIDVIGKDYWEQNMQSVAVDGRMVILAFMSGPVVDGVNLGMILRKRITVKKNNNDWIRIQSNSLCYRFLDLISVLVL